MAPMNMDPALFPNLTKRTALDGLASAYDSLGACLAALEILEAGAATGDATAIQHAVASLDRQVKEAASHLAPALRALLVAAAQPAAQEGPEKVTLAPETHAAAPAPLPAELELQGFPSNVRMHFAAARGDQKTLDEELRTWFTYRDPSKLPLS